MKQHLSSFLFSFYSDDADKAPRLYKKYLMLTSELRARKFPASLLQFNIYEKEKIAQLAYLTREMLKFLICLYL